MRQYDSQTISSALLGKAAYDRTLGKKPVPTLGSARMKAAPAATAYPRQSDKAPREIKASVLRTLHARSNAGMVTIKDVSRALDRLMKEA